MTRVELVLVATLIGIVVLPSLVLCTVDLPAIFDRAPEDPGGHHIEEER